MSLGKGFILTLQYIEILNISETNKQTNNNNKLEIINYVITLIHIYYFFFDSDCFPSNLSWQNKQVTF